MGVNDEYELFIDTKFNRNRWFVPNEIKKKEKRIKKCPFCETKLKKRDLTKENYCPFCGTYLKGKEPIPENEISIAEVAAIRDSSCKDDDKFPIISNKCNKIIQKYETEKFLKLSNGMKIINGGIGEDDNMTVFGDYINSITRARSWLGTEWKLVIFTNANTKMKCMTNIKPYSNKNEFDEIMRLFWIKEWRINDDLEENFIFVENEVGNIVRIGGNSQLSI